MEEQCDNDAVSAQLRGVIALAKAIASGDHAGPASERTNMQVSGDNELGVEATAGAAKEEQPRQDGPAGDSMAQARAEVNAPVVDPVKAPLP